MEFKPETESNRHPVVSILKKIGRIAGLLIIGEEDPSSSEQLPKPKKPRRVDDGPHFVVDSIQGVRPAALEALYEGIYEKAIMKQPPRRQC